MAIASNETEALSPLRSALLAPLSYLFAAGVALRRVAFDAGVLRQTPAPVFTVSVGGLEAGGSGKTPVTDVLLDALHRSGRNPGLLSRGYGRVARGLALRAPGEEALPSVLGDEPAMLVQGGRNVHVAACARRVVGAAALADRGCGALVLDDGFSHRYLSRHVDIVVLRGEAPFGNGHMLPWGTLREPPASLGRAHVAWLHFRGLPQVDPPSWCSRLCAQADLVISAVAPDCVVDARGRRVDPRRRRVVAAAGIARPRDVRQTLETLGADVVDFVPMPDHYAYRLADAERLADRVRARRADALVVTAKDAVKLARLWRGDDLWIVRVRLVIVRGSGALARRLSIDSSLLTALE